MRMSDWSSDVCSSDLLEDMEKFGGKFGSSLDTNGVDGVAKGLEGLAVLHGSLWGNPILDQHAWLQTSMATPIDNDQIRIMWPYIEANLADENVRAILPEKFVNDTERLQRAFDKLADWEMAQKSPRCVNLGDCHQGDRKSTRLNSSH